MLSQKDAFAQQGYLVLRQQYPLGDLARLSQIVQAVYQQWIELHQQDAGFDTLVNMHSLTHPHYFVSQPEQRLELFNLLANAQLVAQLEQIFGSTLYFHNTQLFFNPKNPLQHNYWHRDLQYSPIPDETQRQVHQELCSLHMRIPLLDETGIELIPHSHQAWDTPLERTVRFAQDGLHQHDDLPDSELIALQRGDVLIFNAQMIHRGRYDFDQQRLALDICIGTPHKLLAGTMNQQIQPDAEELALIQHNRWYVEAARLKSLN
jgi:ectoine hydroxylase-related dioxygenase (phytanoyl-CoA dioxygenase family)